jgi:hypothetical protein
MANLPHRQRCGLPGAAGHHGGRGGLFAAAGALQRRVRGRPVLNAQCLHGAVRRLAGPCRTRDRPEGPQARVPSGPGPVFVRVRPLFMGTWHRHHDRRAGAAGRGRGTADAGLAGLVLGAFPREKRAAAVGLFSAVGALSAAVWPAFGSWVIEPTSWRWVFLINAPMGLLAWVPGRSTCSWVRSRAWVLSSRISRRCSNRRTSNRGAAPAPPPCP